MKATLKWIAGCAVLALLVTGYADSTRLRFGGGPKPVVPWIHSEPKSPDEAREALQFLLRQRLPPGTTALDPQRYSQALKHAKHLPWYSSARGIKLPASTPLGQLQQLDTWQPLGPGNIGGRTRVFQFLPGDPKTMFIAGVAGGLWKSADSGAHWAPLTDLLPNIAITSMVIDSSNPQRMWVGTGEGVFAFDSLRGAGIFESLDGGVTWNQLASTAMPSFYYVNALVQSPNAPDTLYAATSSGVYRSLDAGNTWVLVFNVANSWDGCTGLVALPAGPSDTLLASCGIFGFDGFGNPLNGSIARNSDAGGTGTWTQVLSVSNQGRSSVAVSKSNPEVLYALVASGEQTGSSNDRGLRGVWKSTDAGITWVATDLSITDDKSNNNLLLSNPYEARSDECFGNINTDYFLNQGWYDNVITVDPVDPDRVWVGGIDLWRSDDGGQNWGVASYWWFDPSRSGYVHADQHTITFSPSYDGTTNQQMFVTNDGGIFRTDNAEAAVGVDASSGSSNSVCGLSNLPEIAWANLNNGYAVTQFYDGAVFPDNTAYFGGAQDNGTIIGSTSKGQGAWSHLLGGDGGYVAVDPQNTNVLYGEYTGLSMQRSVDGGQTFNDATTGITDGGLFVNPFVMDNNDSQRFWTAGHYLWRTDNGMNSWSQATDFDFESYGVSALAVAPGFPDFVLLGTEDGRVYRVLDATSATPLTPAPTTYASPRTQNFGYVAAMAFDPRQHGTDPDTRMVVLAASTFNFKGPTPQESHVFQSSDGGQTWAGIDGMTPTGPSPDGLPDIPVNTVAIDPSTPNTRRIFVGTDIGVFITADGGNTWARENAGFANTSVRKLVLQVNPTTGQLELFAFTHGRGVFKTVVRNNDPIFANGFE
jgi:hypothetical protein